MTRPPFEVADIIREYGNSFIEKNRSWLTWLHLRVLFAIEHCRTAALGGHLDRCCQCGYEATSFNSCRSRHCPKCQTNARNNWLAERSKELLPVKYVHVVSSPFRMTYRGSPYRTRRSSMTSCSTPAPRRCWRLPPIPGTWAPRSVSSVCSTPGGRIYRFIPTFTASSRRAASRPIINAGFAHATRSSSR